MVKNYSLIFIAFLCFSLSGFGQDWTENFDTETSGYGTGNITINSRVWSRRDAGNFSYGTNIAGSRAFVINDDKSGAHITTPLLNTCGTVTFDYAYINGSSSNTFDLQTSTDGTNFTTVDTQTLGASSEESYVSYSYNINSTSATTYVRILSDNMSGHLAIDNFSVTDYAASPCSGTPTPGNTESSETTVESGGTTVLTLENSTSGSGVTYQWQSSTTSAVAGFSNVSGETSSAYTATVNEKTWYRCVVTCSGNNGTSTAVLVDVSACTSIPSSNDSDGISSVTVGSATFSVSDVTQYTYTGSVPDLEQGANILSSITFETGYTYDTHIWIDFNDDNVFDNITEKVFTGESADAAFTTLTTNFTLAASAALGQHKMRIGTADSGQGTPDPCYSGSYGVTIDLDVNIITSCTPATDPVGGITGTSPACTSTVLTYTGADSATAYWQSAIDGTSTSEPATATKTVSASGTYYIRINDGTCWSTGTVNKVVVINSLPTTVTTPSPATAATGVCYAGVGSISAVSWSPVEGATSYDVYFGAGSIPGIVTSNVASTSYSTGALLASTTYYWKVVAINTCGESVSVINWSFTTTSGVCACDSEPTSNDNNGITSVTVGSATFAVLDVTQFTYTGSIPSLTQGELITSSVSFATGYSYDTHLWIDFNDDGIFNNTNELVFSGESLNTNPTTLTTSFTLGGSVATGQHKMRIGTADNGQATPDPCYSGTFGVTIDLDVNIIASCTPVHTFSSMLPTSGPEETEITVTGTGFTASTTASFGGVSATIDFVDANTIIVHVPAGAATSIIKLTEAGCDITTGAFTIIEESNCGTGTGETKVVAFQGFEFVSSPSWTFSVDNESATPTGLQNYEAHDNAVEWSYYNQGAVGSSTATDRNSSACMSETYNLGGSTLYDNGVNGSTNSNTVCRNFSGNQRGVYGTLAGPTANNPTTFIRSGANAYIQQSRNDGGDGAISKIYFDAIQIPDVTNATNIKVRVYVSSISSNGASNNGVESTDNVRASVAFGSTASNVEIVPDLTSDFDWYFASINGNVDATSAVSGGANQKWDYLGNEYASDGSVSGTVTKNLIEFNIPDNTEFVRLFIDILNDASDNKELWAIDDIQIIADYPTSEPVEVSAITDNSDCSTLAYSVTATEGDTDTPEDLTYQWYFNNGVNDVWSPVTSASPAGYTILGEDGDNLLMEGDTNSLNDLANYQFYCEVTEAGSCTNVSNTMKPNYNMVTWNGTWSSTPDIYSTVILDDDYDTSIGGVQTSFSACSLIINNGAQLTIANNTYVKVENDLTVNGEIIVNTDGAFVQVNDYGIVDGAVLTTRNKITVEKQTAHLESAQEYTYWSAPVQGELISDGLAEANPSRIYWYDGKNYLDETKEADNNNATVTGQDDVDDNADDWQNATGSTVMAPGVGYGATHNSAGFINPAAYTYYFEGPFNNGSFNVPIYRNDSETNDNNWNLIGNPYPSAIDANAFLAANASIGESVAPMTGAIFFWSHATAAAANTNGNENLNYAQSDYAIINGSGQTMGGDQVTPNPFIPSGQAFFIAMDDDASATVVSGAIKTANVVFNNSMRVTGNNDQFFRATTANQSNKLWLNLNTDNGAFNQILIAYVNGATDEDDGMYYDALRNLYPDINAMIYSLLEDTDSKQFAIQGKEPNNLTLEEVIPLGLITNISEPTIYTISLDQFEGAFMTENAVYINDKLLNTFHNLKTSDYTFTSETGTINDRFEIVFRPTVLSIDDNVMDSNEVTITELQNGDIEIKVGHTHTIKHVDIIDITGRRVYSLQGHDATEVYNLSKLSQAAYIAKITLSNGQVISKKAIKQK